MLSLTLTGNLRIKEPLLPNLYLHKISPSYSCSVFLLLIKGYFSQLYTKSHHPLTILHIVLHTEDANLAVLRTQQDGHSTCLLLHAYKVYLL